MFAVHLQYAVYCVHRYSRVSSRDNISGTAQTQDFSREGGGAKNQFLINLRAKREKKFEAAP